MFGFLDSLIAAGFTWLILIGAVLALGAFGFIAFNFLAVQKFLSEVSKALRDLFGLVLPKKWDSGKTLLMLSLFSWAVSLFVTSAIQNVIAFTGWIFLIGGIHWVMNEEKGLKELLTINGIFIGPWITGALICYFLFATTERIPSIAFILWPIFSAVIAGIPRFIGSDPVLKSPIWIKPKPDDRQYIVNLALLNLLLTCWIQLGFITQGWFSEYSGLQLADFANSPFVIRTGSRTEADSRGVDLLNQTEAAVKTNLEGQSWSQVERWLLNFEEELDRIEATLKDQLPNRRDNTYWNIDGEILPGEYNVQLFSIWQGPSADASGYYYSKTCQISKVAPIDLLGKSPFGGSSLPKVGNAKVQCGAIEGPVKGQPG